MNYIRQLHACNVTQSFRDDRTRPVWLRRLRQDELHRASSIFPSYRTNGETIYVILQNKFPIWSLDTPPEELSYEDRCHIQGYSGQYRKEFSTAIVFLQ